MSGFNHITIPFTASMSATQRRDLIKSKTAHLKPLWIVDMDLQLHGHEDIKWDQQNDTALGMADSIIITYAYAATGTQHP